MSDVSYAALTRAKAKFGKRLTENDYKSLLDCESVAEVMAYLKSNTRYIEAFGEANERGIRRGLFESLLRQYISNEIDSISRYELSVGEEFSAFVAHKNEIESIVHFLTLLNSSDSEEDQNFNFTVPRHIAKKTTINTKLLSQAKTYSQFAESLRNTPYYSVVNSFEVSDGGDIPITDIENRLFVNLYRGLRENIIVLAHSTEEDELLDLFDTVMDYENFLRIIRFKKYYNSDYSIIKKYLLPFGRLSEKTLDEMLKAESSKQVFEIMKKTKSGKLLDKVEYSHTGELLLRIKYLKAKHNMYFSDSPAAVMISYLILCYIELHNLICIIEGARYSVARDKIQPLLIY